MLVLGQASSCTYCYGVKQVNAHMLVLDKTGNCTYWYGVKQIALHIGMG